MNSDAFLIRPEEAADEDAIAEVTRLAFEGTAFGDGGEAAIIAGLRQAGDLSLSFVAVEDGTIFGHVAFSPATIDGDHDSWFGLGPISVHPDRQQRGIGSALVRTGLSRLRAEGAKGCVLVGDPAYYSRFGFVADGRLSYAGIDRRYVQRLVLVGEDRIGDVRYAPAFGAH